MCDITGRIVSGFNEPISYGSQSIKMVVPDGIQNGIYFVTLHSENSEVTKKFFVLR